MVIGRTGKKGGIIMDKAAGPQIAVEIFKESPWGWRYWSMVGGNIWLAMLAGYMNAFSTVSLLFKRSAHMSGRATDLGRGLMAPFVLTDVAARTRLFEEAVIIAIMTVSFVAGAVLGTKLKAACGMGKALIMVGLLISVGAVTIYMGLPAGVLNVFSLERAIWAILLCVPMGMQNAVTSLTPIGRSTHITGTLTDLGTAIADKAHSVTVHLSCRWGGFVLGGSVGLWVFFHLPSLFSQMLILAAATIITGAFYAHPAIRRKLGKVIGDPDPKA